MNQSESSAGWPRGIGYVRKVLLLAVLYFSVSWLGFQFSFAQNRVVLVWPACGVALAGLYGFGRGLWPGIWIGTFAAAMVQSGAPLFAVLAGAGNSLGAAIGASWLRSRPFQPELGRVRDVVCLFLVSLVNAAVNGICGSLSLWGSGIIAREGVTTALGVWWLGDAMGILMTAPVLLVWCFQPLPPFSWRKAGEAFLLALSLATAGWLVFGDARSWLVTHTLTYAIFPFIVWAALRFGQRGVVVGMLFGISFAIDGTARGLGPFAMDSIHQSMIQLDVYIFVVCFISMVLAAFLAEHERLEDEMRLALHRAEQATLTKSRFLANMSHEIRTPINGIQGMAELLLGSNLSAKAEDYVHTIVRSSRELLTVINDILDFSKMEAGKLEFQRKPFLVPQLTQDLVRLLEWKAREKEIELITRVDDEVPEVIVGDPARLRQALLNLLSNAVKFTDRGSVHFEVSRLEASPEQAEPTANLCFRVKDTGIGIAEEKLESVFDPFSQGDPSMSRKYGGTGLGLVITREIVEQMGGQIEVESALGVGSTFTFEVPFALPTESEARDARPASATRKKRRAVEPRGVHVLLVEDNAINRRVAGEFLRMGGFSWDEARNGKEAVMRFGQAKYDLILMDCQMPEMDGFEATKQIRAMEQGRSHIPIVALTANAMPEDRAQCLASGMDDFLAKPVRSGQLWEMIEAHL
ncbi:MASE1 domain-containing protein [Sulfidibacter corallicola]|uniref:Sensory/regulatory protein RpfC n=1 Tax=Sulfidibacter corallicola TaxID=2818388 RepID=A0A8A4TGD0_SULCO|nr:ATP-binding protein [Sulfidibacter corallicola]QTD48703.1 MASE1 domain-containing protein [Sulfidibacter corallicola]